MCLTKEEAKKLDKQWMTIIGFLVTYGLGGVWWAATISSELKHKVDISDASAWQARITQLQIDADKGDRFTDADGRHLQHQIDSVVKLVAKVEVALQKLDERLDNLDHHDHPYP